ncbi:MAG TPA: hypothetical protein VMW91_09135 [Desulfosporosinus sp.]|nr:hypothetical protein [Desulfosporosinus sp.]
MADRHWLPDACGADRRVNGGHHLHAAGSDRECSSRGLRAGAYRSAGRSHAADFAYDGVVVVSAAERIWWQALLSKEAQTKLEERLR